MFLNSSNFDGSFTTISPAVSKKYSTSFYLGIYFALCLAVSIFRIYGYIYAYKQSIRGSKNLFQTMLFKVLRAPLRWIDTVPFGRVMNRFTTDFNTVDFDIVVSFSFLLPPINLTLIFLIPDTLSS